MSDRDRERYVYKQRIHNLEKQLAQLLEIETGLRADTCILRQELLDTQKANTRLTVKLWSMRNCENCTMRGCNNKEDEATDIACVNSDHDKWEFAQHQPLAYDVHQELRSAQKTTKQRSNQIQAMRNCENCNERGCGDNENIGIACINNNRDKWEFEP